MLVVGARLEWPERRAARLRLIQGLPSLFHDDSQDTLFSLVALILGRQEPQVLSWTPATYDEDIYRDYIHPASLAALYHVGI